MINHSVSLREAAQGIINLGDKVTFVLTGEPGIGKSSMLNIIAEAKPTHHVVYLDAPHLDISDLGMRIPVHDTKSLVQYLTDKFPRDGKPFIVDVDEVGKARGMLRLMLARLLLEHYIGDWKLPEGSIVFATMNNATDGLGDIMQGHEGNRVTVVPVSKSTANEWLPWATDNKVNPIIRAWVGMEKQCLRSYYEEGQESNPYIFNPKSNPVSYVSPRSLVKAGYILDGRHHLTANMLSASLAGTVGAPAAGMITALVNLNAEVKSTKDVIADPGNTPLPANMSAAMLMIFNAIDDIETQDDLSAFMRYVERIGSSELEAVFFTTLVQGKRTVKLARGNAKVSKWAASNVELFA